MTKRVAVIQWDDTFHSSIKQIVLTAHHVSDTEHAIVSKKGKTERVDGGEIKGWTDGWKDGGMEEQRRVRMLKEGCVNNWENRRDVLE